MRGETDRQCGCLGVEVHKLRHLLRACRSSQLCHRQAANLQALQHRIELEHQLPCIIDRERSDYATEEDPIRQLRESGPVSAAAER
jgi:hypothetical protein